MSLISNILRTSDIESARIFYRGVCGMLENAGSDGAIKFSFPTVDPKYPALQLELIQDSDFDVDSSGYWKIGFGLHNVDAAATYLQSKGIDAHKGSQFFDIGYLSHLKDPQGYTIELLQRTFEKNFQSIDDFSGLLNQPKSVSPVIGQITLRVLEADRSISFYESLGMKLLCIEAVDEYDFDLYFLAFTDDDFKDSGASDIRDVSVREWLYQRPYTTLELQVRRNRSDPYVCNDLQANGRIGHLGMRMRVSKQVWDSKASEMDALQNSDVLTISDPDGFTIYLHYKQNS